MKIKLFFIAATTAALWLGGTTRGQVNPGDCPRADPGCGSDPCGRQCDIVCLKPWKCADLEMKPVEPTCHSCCGLHGLLWCPPKEEKEENGEKKNGNGEKNGEKKDGDGKEAKNGNGGKKDGNGEEKKEEEKAEEPAAPPPLMGAIQCCCPDLYRHLECNGVKVYGWVQGGFTANFASPNDRLNYGVNFNNRSNDFLFNQAPYVVLEKPLDLEKKKDRYHLGYRVDFFYGHDAPYFENSGLGFLDNVLGDRLEYSRLNENGISLPQFYVDLHTPLLTERGMDVRVGRFYTLMGTELTPAPQTDFYSHSYEFFFNAFTHTGVMTTTYLADTVSLFNGLVRGWEVVFDDVNDAWSYMGGFDWKSCDQRRFLHVTWMTGPEQPDNNRDTRTTLSAHYTRKFGCRDQWRFVTGGLVSWDENAATDPLTGAREDAEWYDYVTYLFYTVDPRLILGIRAEWFRDDDGVRTPYTNSDHGGALFNRPGYAGSFYEVTLGFTWKPYQNLRIRPEMRFDWFDGEAIDGSRSRPFNDQRDNFQTTAAFDVIWEF